MSTSFSISFLPSTWDNNLAVNVPGISVTPPSCRGSYWNVFNMVTSLMMLACPLDCYFFFFFFFPVSFSLTNVHVLVGSSSFYDWTISTGKVSSLSGGAGVCGSVRLWPTVWDSCVVPKSQKTEKKLTKQKSCPWSAQLDPSAWFSYRPFLLLLLFCFIFLSRKEQRVTGWEPPPPPPGVLFFFSFKTCTQPARPNCPAVSTHAYRMMPLTLSCWKNTEFFVFFFFFCPAVAKRRGFESDYSASPCVLLLLLLKVKAERLVSHHGFSVLLFFALCNFFPFPGDNSIWLGGADEVEGFPWTIKLVTWKLFFVLFFGVYTCSRVSLLDLVIAAAHCWTIFDNRSYSAVRIGFHSTPNPSCASLNLQTHTRRRGSNYDVMSSTGQKNKNKSKEGKKGNGRVDGSEAFFG